MFQRRFWASIGRGSWLSALSLMFSLAFLISSSAAADKYWIGGSGAWGDPANWSPWGAPLSGDDAFLSQDDATDRTVVLDDGNHTVDSLQIGASGSGTIGLVLDGALGDLSLSIDNGGLYVGRNGTGFLSFRGGHLTSQGEEAVIGYNGEGVFEHSGGRYDAGTLLLGFFGRGEYSLSGSGYLSTGLQSIGARGGAGSGTSEFQQTGGTNAASSLYIGFEGGLGRYAQSAGTTTAYLVTLGHDGGMGTYDLDGTGHLAANDMTLGVSGGSGTFNQQGGSNHVSGTLALGSFKGTGVYNLLGGDLSSNSVAVGYLASGTFNQSGGNHTVHGTMTLAENPGSFGTYNLDGGVLNANRIVVNPDGVFNFKNGVLEVGEFQGDLVNLGGTLSPGQSIGAATILGDYTQSSMGALHIEIGGPVPGSQYDVLNVFGNADLDGSLYVSLFGMGVEHYTPGADTYFDILTAESLSGTFSQLSFAGLEPGLRWSVSYLADVFGSRDVVRLSAEPVPLPPTLWLFGSGLVGLIMIRRREAGRHRRA